VGPGAARAIWIGSGQGMSTGRWATLASGVKSHWEVLRRISDIAAEGPVRFPVSVDRPPLELEYMTPWENCLQSLAVGIGVSLQEGKTSQAWPLIEALTRLANRPGIEPIGAAQMHHRRWLEKTARITWEYVQAGGSADAELAALQRIWMGGNGLSRLPEVIAVERAARMDLCQWARTDSAMSLGGLVRSLWPDLQLNWSDPGCFWDSAVQEWRGWRRNVAYQRWGSYREELAAGRYFRDQEIAMRDAVHARTWRQLEGHPAMGATAIFALPGTALGLGGDSRGGPVAEMTEGSSMPANSLLGRAFAGEVLRRVCVVALALERHRLRHGEPPARLEDLDTDLSPVPAVDPVDGAALRYRREEAGSFVLYSVGLDGRDDGGDGRGVVEPQRGPRHVADIVWPRRATAREIAAFEAEEASRRRGRPVQVVTGALPLSPELMRRFGLPSGRAPSPTKADEDGGDGKSATDGN